MGDSGDRMCSGAGDCVPDPVDPRDQPWLEMILWLRARGLSMVMPRQGAPYFLKRRPFESERK